VIFSHQFGWEVRLLVGSHEELVSSQVCRTQEEPLRRNRNQLSVPSKEACTVNVNYALSTFRTRRACGAWTPSLKIPARFDAFRRSCYETRRVRCSDGISPACLRKF
jgi:hypothetical protein